MKKRVYKKNKEGIEVIIFQYPSRQKNFTITILSLSLLILFFAMCICYIHFSLVSHSLPVTGDIQKVLSYKTQHKSTSINTTNWLTDNIASQTDHIIWHGPRDKKQIALTFDADMTPVMVHWLHSGKVQTYNDPRITDYLKQNKIKATFFLTGLWIESYPEATRELAENPLFELENHSYSHPSMAGACFGQPQIPEAQYPFEIEKTQQLIEQYTHKSLKYFRFPGGCYNQSVLALVKREGLITVHWDDVADDGFNKNKEAVINNVLNEAKNGSIIVLHMGGPSNVPVTADALPVIIAQLKEKGYTFVTVSELLNSPTAETKLDPQPSTVSVESFKSIPL